MGWLGRVSEAETFQANERDQLLLEIHSQLGNKEQAAAAAWRIFRRDRSAKALDRLLAVLGQDQREAVLEGELTAIRGRQIRTLPETFSLNRLRILLGTLPFT